MLWNGGKLNKGSKAMRDFLNEADSSKVIVPPPRVLTHHARERIKERNISLSEVMYNTNPSLHLVLEGDLVITAYHKVAFPVRKPKQEKRNPKQKNATASGLVLNAKGGQAGAVPLSLDLAPRKKKNKKKKNTDAQGAPRTVGPVANKKEKKKNGALVA